MMPMYDYRCPQGHFFEQMATIADRARQNCPVSHRRADPVHGLLHRG